MAALSLYFFGVFGICLDVACILLGVFCICVDIACILHGVFGICVAFLKGRSNSLVWKYMGQTSHGSSDALFCQVPPLQNCTIIENNLIQYNAMRYDTMQYNTIHNDDTNQYNIHEHSKRKITMHC